MTADFLDLLKRSRLGRMKIYLGMAAGVGKTVAMLREAKRLKGEGVDVVVGLVETHGRAETIGELEGLEVVPRKRIVYRSVPLDEMDVDAVVARNADLVLVDELAHTNVPGSSNEKRYQDVDALLDRGVSVMGTLNVQHLESLHGIVLRETGVDVRERVPDRFVKRADEVVVIDLSPDDLQERLRQGKIYPAEKVERALAGFFQSEKLVALRQLALREVANAVEQRARARVRSTRDLDEERQQHIADAERVMVCMSSQPSATRRLMRHGARLAGGLASQWFVVYVQTAQETTRTIDSASLRSLTKNVSMAKELGAEVVKLEGNNVVTALAEFAESRGITHAVFGRTRQSVWRERLSGSVINRFMRAVPEIDVLVVGIRSEEEGETSR